MKNSNFVSSVVLRVNGLLFLVLGARVLLTPAAFAEELGFVSVSQPLIDSLSAVHSGSFLALGAAALMAAWAPVLARWSLLALLSLLGVVAWFSLWSLSGHYAVLLSALLAINLVALITAFFGEPLFDLRPPGKDGDDIHLRWG